MKNKMAKVVAKAVKSMANKACGSASIWGVYQPKEPKNIKK